MLNRIKTNRLILKPYCDTDQNRMIELLTNENIKETFMIPNFHSMSDAISMFKKIQSYSYSDDHYELGVYLEENLIGFVNDVSIENEKIELGYVIDPNFHNKGYATEAIAAVIKDLFQKGYKEVCAGAFESNKASCKVMEKCGMKRIDKEEDILYKDKKHHCIYYSIKQI